MRERARSSTRAILLAAAAEEFAKHGLEGTGVRAIVERAGINERMIYHHFESKEGLYRAVLADQWGGLAAAWQPALDEASALAPREGLLHAFTALFELLVARPLMLPLAMHEALSGWKAISPATLNDLPASLRTLYERGRASGEFRKEYDFELFYLTAMGALTALTTISPRFKDLKARSRADAKFAAQLAKRMLALLFDGAAIPRRKK
jgi:AcrR family transcriptional regulator